VKITLNGIKREVEAGVSVAALLAELGLSAQAVAVERNLELVPRARLALVRLEPGDRVEIVTLVGGG
jgi:thiamine biosynthesis protein ThiS